MGFEARCVLFVERVVGGVGHGVVGVALGTRVLPSEQSTLDLARLREGCLGVFMGLLGVVKGV